MLATRIDRLTSSLVRDILAAAASPDVISFAGGLPATEALYQPELAALDPAMVAQALQYGPSEGEPALREQVAGQLRAQGLPCSAEQVLILNGSQQGIDLLAKLLIEPGRSVLLESPTYLAALQAFRLFGAELHGLEQGMGIDADSAMDKALGHNPCMVYLNPTFQNPTGHCLSAAERQRWAAKLDRSGTVVFEDDPYRDLAYDAPAPAPLVAHLKQTPWVYQGSFSKILAPGLRLGYLVAHRELFPHLLRLKQAADLHSNRLSQLLVLEALQQGRLQRHLARILPLYRARRDAMAASLSRHLAGLASWMLPQGGLFFWLELQRPCDTLALMRDLLECDRVAVMPGSAFFAAPAGSSYLRLNFSHADAGRIDTGLALLAKRLHQAG
ncbi:aminotransferase-like domain-containing protein [Chitinilyticum piscinae]|uniref:Putative 8-amino-7-oxononanoate synthase n=1 Tax=Chitinilyticum piscinae TaxID=2866724 RepID=A0A8J7FHZ3_9NEIS|nr:PLP-dependent aminotransferase family protein [Chitinilyticum piscinae]MBE9609798.1 PLP-dependent aminotransferase family protein [Chitinilyticum piscinae]